MDEDVNPLLIEHLRQRAAFGAKKYGIPLRTFDGRNTIQDALEEALDTAVYLTKLRREWDEIADLLEEAASFIAFLGDQLSVYPKEVTTKLNETAARMRRDVERIQPVD